MFIRFLSSIVMPLVLPSEDLDLVLPANIGWVPGLLILSVFFVVVPAELPQLAFPFGY
jgi:hypothetical protein